MGRCGNPLRTPESLGDSYGPDGPRNDSFLSFFTYFSFDKNKSHAYPNLAGGMCVKIFMKLLGCGLLMLFILSGCGGKGEDTAPTAYRVVQRIHVTYENGGETLERSYETREKMQMILNYLRWVSPYGTPGEDPMSQPGEEFRVELRYSDGTAKTYHQRCDRYLRTGDGPWKRIDPVRGGELRRLLEALEREPDASEEAPLQPLLRPKLSRGSEIWCAEKGKNVR